MFNIFQCFNIFFPFPAEQVDGATVSSQPADSTSTASDTERTDMMDEGVVGEEDGEPNAAELRRRRLRKLETASSSSSSPPPDNWSTRSDSDILLWTNRNSELIDRCFGSSLPLFLVALAFHRLRFLTVSSWTLATGRRNDLYRLSGLFLCQKAIARLLFFFACFHHLFPPQNDYRSKSTAGVWVESGGRGILISNPVTWSVWERRCLDLCLVVLLSVRSLPALLIFFV